MTTYTSINVCSEATGYEALYEHDRGTEQVIVKNTLISSADVAEARAISEFLKGGYTKREVSITSYYIPNIKQNDIIAFKGFNWIVKEINYDFNPPELLMKIKGVRYE
jgi:hypothetical protein